MRSIKSRTDTVMLAFWLVKTINEYQEGEEDSINEMIFLFVQLKKRKMQKIEKKKHLGGGKNPKIVECSFKH